MTNLKHLTLVSVLIAGSCLNAQDAYGTIVGIVRGPNRNPVAGATITLSGAQLLGSRSAPTDAQGNFRLPLVLPGQYTVRVSMQGFMSRTATVNITSGSTVRVDLDLRSVSTQEEVVEIVGTENPIMDKTDTKVASTYTATELQSLPTGTSGVYAGLLLAPGVAGTDYARMRGSQVGATRFLMNGMAIQDPTSGQGRQYENNIEDLVQDVQVIQNPINAKYGFTSSGLVSLTTKTGTNDFQGSFRVKMNNVAWRTYYFYEHTRWGELENNSRLSAPFVYNDNNPTNDEITRNYQITISGPIIKDKLTFTYGARIIPKNVSTGTRRNVLASNPINNETYIPGFTHADPIYTGPDPTVSGNPQSPIWAGYIWGSDPFAPTRPLTIQTRTVDDYSSYKLFWQITPNHTLEGNYTTNPYTSGVNFTGWLGDEGYPMNIQQASTRLTRSFSYRGIIGTNGVLTATYGNTYTNVNFANGPDDPLFITLWNSNAAAILYDTGRVGQIVSGGGTPGTEIRGNNTYLLDYNHILDKHNIDIGIQMIEENSSWNAGGVNNRRFYSPARRYDGTYMVFNVQDPNSPIWTGEGIQLAQNESLSALRNNLLNGSYVPTYIDYTPDGVNDINFVGTTTSFYINDNWTLNDYWAINLGLRVDNTKAEDYTGERFNTTSYSPRIRFQYDLFGDNQHVFAFAATQSRGTLGRQNLGGVNHTSSGALGFANSGSSVERRYFWNQGSAQPHWVNYDAVKTVSNYGYYYYYADHSQSWLLDPDLKPQTTTAFEFNYRRAFAQGGYFRISLVYNYLTDGLAGELRDEVIDMTDPSGAQTALGAPATYLRYLYNRSDRGRVYGSAEMEWMLPIINQASYRLNWHGNWTIAKATGNALYGAAYSQYNDAAITIRYPDILEKVGVPQEVSDPWGEVGGVPRHMAKTWFSFAHGVRGGIINEVSLLGTYESGSATQTTVSHNLPANTFVNSNRNGGRLTDMPTAYALYPWGRGHRKGNDIYYVDLQWNVTIPVKDRLSMFVNVLIGNVFNSMYPTSIYSNWTAGQTRTWTGSETLDSALWGKLVPSRENGRVWGVTNGFQGYRQFNTQFDVGFRF